MRKIGWLFSLVFFIFILVACGQGNNQDTTPIDNSGAVSNEDEAGTSEENDSTIEESEEVEETVEDTVEEETATEESSAVIPVTLYFADDQLMEIYGVNTGLTVTVDEDGAKQAYELWLTGPTKENLVRLTPERTRIQTVQFRGDVAHVSFSEDILEANLGSSGELMLIEQIALIAQQFGYGQTQILVDGEIPSSFLGHMDVSEPVKAGNPEDYPAAN